MKNSLRKSLSLFEPLALALIFTTSCGQLMGNLRRDLDDSEPYMAASEPVTGGRWTEKGFLNEEMPDGGYGRTPYASIGHSEREPASAPSSGFSGSQSWISPDAQEASRRDIYRSAETGEAPAVSFSNTPDLEPSVKRKYKNGNRASRADFVDESQNEGSLWASDGQTNYYFTKNKIRSVGDIISLAVEPDLATDVVREVTRTLSPKEKTAELNLAQDRIRAKYLGQPSPDLANPVIAKKEADKDTVPTNAASPERAPVSEGQKSEKKPEVDEDKIPIATAADMDLTKTLEIKAGDVMMGEIVERYPNVNYKIRALKKIPYKKGSPRLITLIGVVKGTDITEEDTTSSGKLYEYRLEAIR